MSFADLERHVRNCESVSSQEMPIQVRMLDYSGDAHPMPCENLADLNVAHAMGFHAKRLGVPESLVAILEFVEKLSKS